MKKTLPIAEALYPKYFILFMFDNATSHSVYAENTLCAHKMNNKPGCKPVILCNCWYIGQISMYHIQPIWYLGSKRKQIPKSIQNVPTEKELWPATRLNLECPKPKFYNYQMMADCKLFIKDTRCQTCRKKKYYSATCGSGRKCDACVARKKNCQCVSKQYCKCYSEKKGKYEDCEEL